MGRASGFRRWGVLLAGLLAALRVSAADVPHRQADALEIRSSPMLRHFGAAEGLPQVSASVVFTVECAVD